MSPKTILATIGIVCAVASLVFQPVPLLTIAVILIGIAVLL